MIDRSFRVYFVTHAEGRMTAILMRAKSRPMDGPPPTVIASSEDDAFRQLEAMLQRLEVSGEDSAERYLWQETFSTEEVTVLVHPQTPLEKRIVIGAREIPLRLTYVHSRLDAGGYRVVLPRFGWWFVLEDLSLAAEVLRNALSTALLGESARSIYDFRREGDEYVREWSPRFLGRDAEEAEEAQDKHETLDAVAEEWVEKAARGKLPITVGESDDFDQRLPLFDRYPLPSILLVGGAGIGKTAWVRRLAKHLAIKRRDKSRSTPRLYATSQGRIVAGMIYVGMWQKRCLDLVRELEHEGDFLYVDRLVSILEPQSDGASIGELFLSAMMAEEISLIAECSEEELERCERRFPQIVGCFQIVRLTEPAPSAMPAVLDLYQAKTAAKSTVTVHGAGWRRLVAHLSTFQKDARFPGKGFRFLDWLNQEAGSIAKRTLYPRDVSEAYSRYSGLPLELISDEKRAGPDELAAILQRGVIGQDDACATAARVLARLKAGLNDPERPTGTLLFVGPTGVGKTELAKQLARFMFGDEARMIRIDMSEYMFAGAAKRMLDAGSGTTSLAARVRAQPLSLILLDEIEKAHPEVFDLLLGILGEGRLTDSYGRLVDFRMALMVMTSNLGVTEARPVGYGEGDAQHREIAKSVRQHFRPEFVARIDHVISFRRLAIADVLRIVDLELAKTEKRTGLVRRGLSLDVHPAVKVRLAELGWHETRGARPLKRVIEERIVAPIAALVARDPALRDRRLSVVPAGAPASTAGAIAIPFS